MTQSDRSKRVQAQAGWLWYQVNFLEKTEEQAANTVMPKQFMDIFLVGYALGEERAAKRGK